MVRLRLAALCTIVFAGGIARAQPADPAALFDEGVRKFKQADYEGAADAFVRADEASPNAEALLNAIAAGRRGHAHLLVARASQRALARPDTSAQLSRLAREALAEAASHLARVELSCAPATRAAGVKAGEAAAPGGAGGAQDGASAPGACAITVDGAKAAAGTHYVLPGTHRFVGVVPAGTRDEQPLTCNAGATYTVELRPPAAAIGAPTASATAGPAPSATASAGWPPAVVYVGAGVTAALAGLAVWSGVDAIEAKDALPAVPRREQNEDVLARAYRTDGLIAGAVVIGVATAAAAVWLVGWDGQAGAKTKVGVAPSAAGVSAVVQGRF